MFAAYETCKSSALAVLDPVTSRAHESVQLFTGAGFAAICAGGAAAGGAYTLVGAALEQIPALTRQASCEVLRIFRLFRFDAALSMLRSLLPSPVALLATLPAQIFGFVAFEYGRSIVQSHTGSAESRARQLDD